MRNYFKCKKVFFDKPVKMSNKKFFFRNLNKNSLLIFNYLLFKIEKTNKEEEEIPFSFSKSN